MSKNNKHNALDGEINIVEPNVPPSLIFQTPGSIDPVIVFKQDGTVEVGEHATVDELARQFFQIVRNLFGGICFWKDMKQYIPPLRVALLIYYQEQPSEWVLKIAQNIGEGLWDDGKEDFAITHMPAYWLELPRTPTTE